MTFHNIDPNELQRRRDEITARRDLLKSYHGRDLATLAVVTVDRCNQFAAHLAGLLAKEGIPVRQ